MIDQSSLRASLVAWMRWHAANKEEIERAPDQCRLFLEAMSKASGVQAVAMLASEIECEPEKLRPPLEGASTRKDKHAKDSTRIAHTQMAVKAERN